MNNRVKKIFCNECMRLTRHRILYSHRISGEDVKYQFQWDNLYQITECQGCENTSFRIDHTDSESTGELGETVHRYTHYPPLVSRPKPAWFEELPGDIQNVMSEVYTALHAGSRYLATLGARTVIDLLISDKIGDAGTFRGKIENLEKAGYITHPEAELIGAVIEAGNASAHRGFSPDSGSLNAVMDIVETVLGKLYASEGRQMKLANQAAALKKRTPPRRP